MMGTFADILLKLGEAILGRKDRIRDLKRDQADRIADYLMRLSDILTDIVRSLKEGKEPVTECAELAFASRLLPQIDFSGAGIDDVARLAGLLGAARHGPETLVEVLFAKPMALLIEYEENDGIYEGFVHTLPLANALQMDKLDYSQEIPARLAPQIDSEFRKIERAAAACRAVAAFIRVQPHA